MGAAKRDREREGEREKADMYCGCLMTGKRGENKEARRAVREGETWRREVLRQTEKSPGRGGERVL